MSVLGDVDDSLCQISCNPAYEKKPCKCYAQPDEIPDANGVVKNQFCGYEEDGFLIPCDANCCPKKCPGQCYGIKPRKPEGTIPKDTKYPDSIIDKNRDSKRNRIRESSMSIVMFLIILVISLGIISTVSLFT